MASKLLQFIDFYQNNDCQFIDLNAAKSVILIYIFSNVATLGGGTPLSQTHLPVRPFGRITTPLCLYSGYGPAWGRDSSWPEIWPAMSLGILYKVVGLSSVPALLSIEVEETAGEMQVFTFRLGLSTGCGKDTGSVRDAVIIKILNIETSRSRNNSYFYHSFEDIQDLKFKMSCLAYMYHELNCGMLNINAFISCKSVRNAAFKGIKSSTCTHGIETLRF